MIVALSKKLQTNIYVNNYGKQVSFSYSNIILTAKYTESRAKKLDDNRIIIEQKRLY